VIGTSLVFEGIAPAGFQLDGELEVFTPLGQNTEVPMQNRAAHFIHVVGRLASGTTLTEARTELAVLSTTWRAVRF
jgi:hypothetical protein